MKAIILAAGMGTRLHPYTKSLPKSLLEIDGKPLLLHSLEKIGKAGIREAIIVIGFEGEQIKERVGDQYAGVRITYAENPDFATTGSMRTFRAAKELLDEETLLLESDLLYDESALHTLLESDVKDAILVSDLLGTDDDVYVCVDKNRHITNINKRIREEEKEQVLGALVGISKLSQSFLEKAFAKDEADEIAGEHQYHYEETLIRSATEENPLVAIHDQLNWIEIDTEADYKRAQESIYPRIKEANK